MARILQTVLLLVLLSATPWAFSQSTFQKILPGAWNTWGTCAKNSSGGNLTFCTWVHDSSGTSGRDIVLVSMDEQGDTLWTRSYGGPFDDQSFSLIKTNTGGYLIAGTSNTTAASSGPWRSCLIRTDEQGDTLWTRTFSGLGYALALSECDDGGFLVVGMPGLCMLRFDAQGNWIWSRLYDRHTPPDFESEIESRCVTRSIENSYFVGGSNTGGAMFLSKISPTGNVIWSKATSMHGEIRQVEATPDGGLVLAGYVESQIGWDGVLARMDSLGNTVWSKSFDTGTTNGFNSIIRSSDGTYALIGGSEADPLNHDVHFLKTDSLGNGLFSRTFGDAFTDYGLSVMESISAGYLIVARTSSPEPNTSTWVIKTDSTGAGDCFQDSVATIVSDVDLGWWDFPLESFPMTYTEYSTNFSVHLGTTILPLCPVGVYEPGPAQPTIRLFPNPAQDQFTVAATSNENSRSVIEIFNALGDRVMTGKPTSSPTNVDCSSLTRGIYLVKVTTPTTTVTQRVVLE